MSLLLYTITSCLLWSCDSSLLIANSLLVKLILYTLHKVRGTIDRFYFIYYCHLFSTCHTHSRILSSTSLFLLMSLYHTFTLHSLSNIFEIIIHSIIQPFHLTLCSEQQNQLFINISNNSQSTENNSQSGWRSAKVLNLFCQVSLAVSLERVKVSTKYF